jgi:hypothetical protein
MAAIGRHPVLGLIFRKGNAEGGHAHELSGVLGKIAGNPWLVKSDPGT